MSTGPARSIVCCVFIPVCCLKMDEWILENGWRLLLQRPPYLDDDENELVCALINNPVPRQLVPCCEGFVERTVERMSPEEFRSHFRMLPETFEEVLRLVEPELQRSTPGNKTPPRTQLLIALWRMATPDSYRSVLQRFGVGKATAIRCVRRVTHALCSLAPIFIKWPSGERAQQVIRGFQVASTFPGTIGAIDGLHVNIPAPAVNPESYINRKGHYSIQLQAVCDHTRLFTHIYVGNVGSVHDARVFRLSEVSAFMDDEAMFPQNSHLIGDAAYALHSHLMVPYTDNGRLSDQQKNFNFCLSSARMVIERSFGLLRGRWRSLARTLEMIKTENVPNYVLACCVLHNLCLLHQDELVEFTAPNVTEEEGPRPAARVGNRAAAVNKRDVLCNTLPIRNA